MRYRVIALAISILILTATFAHADDIPVDQASLTSGGIAYEINRDGTGNIYVTDWGAGEVWRVQPPTSAYIRFSGLGTLNDARPDASGNIWWTGYDNPILGRIDTGASPMSITTWDLSAWDPARTYSLAGLAMDNHGHVWFSEWGDTSDTQLLYRFDPSTGQLCGYTIPGGNHSYYVVYHNGLLWLGDWVLSRIVQFNPQTLQATYWDTTTVGEPRGLAVDGNGDIWWADNSATTLVRLEPAGPNANRFTAYTLPVSATPYMVAVRGDEVWTTAEELEGGRVGILDPALAAGSTSSQAPTTTSSAEMCGALGSGTTVTTTPASGTLSWSAGTWADITPPGATGWTIYEVSWSGVPYGILAEPDRVWVTEQLYQQLVRVTLGLAAPQVAIQIPGGAADVQLTWSPVASAAQYRVWISELPYFVPGGTPAQESAATSFTHAGVATDPAHNTSYVVRAVDEEGAESADSNRTGKFTFTLTPGS